MAELSSGVLIFRKSQKRGIVWLLLHNSLGHWDLPKGHIKKRENNLQAAMREAAEETGISDFHFVAGFEEEINYFYQKDGKLIFKKAHFYLAETKTKEINLSYEHSGFSWLAEEEALAVLSFTNSKNLLRKAGEILKKRNEIFKIPEERLRVLEGVFKHSSTSLSFSKKVMLYEIIWRLKERLEKPFGLFLIYGWQNKWNKKHCNFPDENQNIFIQKELNKFDIFRHSPEEARSIISKTSGFDGAILIAAGGQIKASGAYIEGMSPKKLAEKLYGKKQGDLSTIFGFKRKVHSRHLTAICASWVFKNSAVYTVSEEDGYTRIFEAGRLIYPPHAVS